MPCGCHVLPCSAKTVELYIIMKLECVPMPNVTATQLNIGGALCGSSVKAKFHYAIQLTNQLASWFASWSASASELNSVMEFGLNSVPCTTPQSLADARCWSAVTLPK